LEGLEELHRGAEAVVFLGGFLGLKAIYKYRPPKLYRAEALDRRLRVVRTLNEARIMVRLRLSGVPVPAVFDVDPDRGVIVMEYIDGKILRDYILEEGSSSALIDAGKILGMIHERGVCHGDPTISNYIIDYRGDLWIIDFGLAEYSRDVEDFAVDLHLLYRSLETLPLKDIEGFKERVFSGYSEILGRDRAGNIARKVREIRMRGRYVIERRYKTVWGTRGEG